MRLRLFRSKRDRLVSSSAVRCRCGRRLAFDPRNVDGVWRCPSVLLDDEDPTDHDSTRFLLGNDPSLYRPVLSRRLR